jgi:hypothetical protein
MPHRGALTMRNDEAREDDKFLFFLFLMFTKGGEIYVCICNRSNDGHQVFLDKDEEKDCEFNESDNWDDE